MALRPFSKEEHSKINALLGKGCTNKEIAAVLKRDAPSVSVYVRKHFGGNINYANRINKYRGMYLPVMRYYMNHSREECCEKFKLSPNELNSVIETGYKKFKNLRKDNRIKTPWSKDDILTLIKCCGIISRKEINNKIKRGKGEGVIREFIEKLGISSKNLNGISFNQYEKIFGEKPLIYFTSKAGPALSNRIVLWVDLDISKIKNPSIAIYIKTMQMFQNWIFENKVHEQINSILTKK